MTKLNEILSTLRGDIRQGKYSPGGKFPSEYVLSEMYDVNRVTVNKAVNMLIKEGYLERARSSRAGTIVKTTQPFPEGIIAFITSMRDSFSTSIVTAAIQTAFMSNYILFTVNPEIDEVNTTLRRLESGGVKGILASHYGQLDTILPVVYIDEDNLSNMDDKCPQLRSDSYGGGQIITEKLLERGHRNIVYLTKSRVASWLDLRRAGVVDALRKHGVTDAESRCFAYRNTGVHHCTLALNKMFSSYPGLTAIICNTDYIAFNVINAAKKSGLDIPGKISVTGYGNVREIQQIYNFTTVDQHPQELGARACEKLIEIINGKDSEKKELETVEVELLNEDFIQKI